MFHLRRRERLVLSERKLGPVTLKQIERLVRDSGRPDKTGVNEESFEGYLDNPAGFGHLTPFTRAEAILGKRCVAGQASVAESWVCTVPDPLYVPYSEKFLESIAGLNESGSRTFRLVFLLGLPLDVQLKQSIDRSPGPRFTRAAQRWITERYRPLLPPKLPSGYRLMDFSVGRLKNCLANPKEVLANLEGTFPREHWARVETVAEAVNSLFNGKEEDRLLADRFFHVGAPETFSHRWLVGGSRPNGLRVIPFEAAGKNAEKLSGSEIGVVTLIAR